MHACLPLQNLLFFGHKEDCAMMDEVHQKQGDCAEEWCNCKITTVVINDKHELWIVICSSF
jgi:hypothetical protein